MRRLAQAFNDGSGSLPPLPGIDPDCLAPIVIVNPAGEREIVLARWGLPSLEDEPSEKPNKGTSNVCSSCRCSRRDYATAPRSER